MTKKREKPSRAAGAGQPVIPQHRRRRSDADRRLKQADHFARIFRILERIQSRGRWNIQSLAEEEECSTRTIHRDLEVLLMAGVPWTYDKDAECYRVRPDYRFPVLNLTEEELMGQATATAITEAAGLNIGKGARPTTQKLEMATNEEASKLLADAGQVMAVLGLKLADHGRHQETIKTVQWALVRRKQLAGQYKSPYETHAAKLTLHPYRLCLVKQAWYLIARPTDRDQPLTYRIARFKTLRMVDAPAEIPEDFDLHGYFGNAWGIYRGDKIYDVEIVFTKDAADIVTETTWHHTQKVKRNKDGTVTLTFQVDGLNEIVHWILGWSGRATVMKPVELREMVVKQLRQAIEMNDV